ncbi:MAG: hypothetical protein H7Z10_07895, partial [Gemmatimonadaceae bacterium]|nr:hypothetical protein [Acetobacteraceae bacterium]
QEHPGAEPPDILDCADAPGRAMEALSLGCRIVVLQPGPAFADIAGRAAALGALVLPAAPPSIDLGGRNTARLLESWLGPT